MKEKSAALSKQARAAIQVVGAILLVFGVQAISNGALFSAWLLLPLAGWLFGRSMAA